ncbi:interferon lambda-4-like [Echinops telfairi]|uniref:Interferon lambda-4-like n=1 Tax=Echinops telfairi TaxID=9371 RepID=A0ABM0IY86_ECHTE|nr:interferon lambda-4-like [Echinops telfairi]
MVDPQRTKLVIQRTLSIHPARLPTEDTAPDTIHWAVEGLTGRLREASGSLAGADMGSCVAATVPLGLWFLVTVGVVAKPGVGEPRRCHLSHYRSLAPTALAAVKELRDRYEEEALSWRPRNCSFRLRRAPPRPASCKGLRQVARDLADAQSVLSGQRRPKPLPGTGQILQLLAAAGREVTACLELVRPGWSRKSLRPPRRRHKARRDDSPQCREATIIFNLLRLLSRDLRLVAYSGPCV